MKNRKRLVSTSRRVRLARGARVCVLGLTVLLTRNASADGGLDGGFGSGGKVTTNFGGSALETAYGVVIQADGKIVVAGSTDPGTADFAIARYETNGMPDTMFGTGGRVTTNVGGADRIYGLALQPDQKIVVAGYSTASGNADVVVARYNTDGSPDMMFGSGGRVTTNVSGSSSDYAEAVVIQPDGKIVIAGYSNASGNNDFLLVRYDASGNLDPGFGTAGIVTKNFGGSASDQAYALALQTDGKLVAAGNSDVNGNKDFAAARFDPQGTSDGTFGSGGLVTTNFTGTNTDEALGLTIQTDGKIILAGHTIVSGLSDFALTRYDTTGTLDPSFGSGGRVVTDLGGSTFENAYAVVVQVDGKVVAAGVTDASGTTDFALVRYDASGVPDAGFGTAGVVTTSFGGSAQEYVRALALQSDGKIVAAGQSNAAGSYDFAVARYLVAFACGPDTASPAVVPPFAIATTQTTCQ